MSVAEVAIEHCCSADAVDSEPARVLSELRSRERALVNERFELMVYGVYNAGKSSLLKTGYPSLEHMLPISSKECTAHLIKIDVGGGTKGADVHFHWSAVAESDSTLRDLLPEKARDFLDEKTIAFAREYVAAGCTLWPEGSEQESPPTLPLSEEEVSAWTRADGGGLPAKSVKPLASVVDHISVKVDAGEDDDGALRVQRQPYNIIDAPGLGADESRRDIAERHLRKCDVPIVVATFETLSLAELQKALQRIKDSGHQPIIVITKLDEQIQRLRRDHRGQHLPTLVETSKAEARETFIQAGFNGGDVHFVSAEWYQLSHDAGVDEIRAELARAGLPPDADERRVERP